MQKRNSFISVFLGILLSLVLYQAYFFNLVREELQVLIQRQGALESLNLLGVPGTAFLNDLGVFFVLKSSLFYLVLLGMPLVVLQLFSLRLKRAWLRVVFILAMLSGLIALLHGDRIAFSFPFVTALAWGTFFLLTLGLHIRTSRKDLITLILLGLVVSSALFMGAKQNFFLKTRDRLLFDSHIGDRVVAYYYTYSPLAAAVISPARGVYEGLIFLEDFQAPFHHLGQGLVLSGNAKAEKAADYVVKEQSNGHEIVNRYGDRTPLPEVNEAEIRRAALSLFSMQGFKTLNHFSLYAFPAGILVLPFLILRLRTGRRKPFVIMSVLIGLGLVVFIGSISLIGTSASGRIQATHPADKGTALSLAYNLHEQREVPDKFIPLVLEFTDSPSTAIRYWGAKLLGYAPPNPEHDKQLLALLEDPSPNVRCAAGLSLHNRLRADSFKLLLPRLLKDPNWYVRCVIFSAFLRSGTIPHRR